MRENNESNILKVGLNLQEGINGAPWAWIDEQTRLTLGFEADIARALANELNMKEEFVSVEGYRSIIGLLKGTFDISISAHKSLNEMSGIIFTDPYYNLTQRIVTLEESTIYDLVDLKGCNVGVLPKSLSEYIIQQENINLPAPIKTKNYNDVLELFSALQFKDISAAFIDSPVALWYSNSNMSKRLVVSDVSYKSGSYSIAIREDNKELRDSINEALKEINLQEILEKYGLWDEAQQN
jgi:ABC-type amino acid transport substrate-binding protein